MQRAEMRDQDSRKRKCEENREKKIYTLHRHRSGPHTIAKKKVEMETGSESDTKRRGRWIVSVTR